MTDAKNEAASGASRSDAVLGAELERELRARINPLYEDIRGTESYERKRLLGEIDRLRDELQLASDTARYACDGWNDALMHEGAHMAAKAIEARKVPNAIELTGDA